MEVYDKGKEYPLFDGKTIYMGCPQSLEWAKQTFDVDIERSEADTKFQVRVLMERGLPLVSVYADVGDVVGPLKSAIVVFHCPDHPSQFLEATDSNGHCYLSLDPGLYNVWIMHDKFESDTVFRLPIDVGGKKLRTIFYLTGRVEPQEPDPPPEEPEEPMTDKVKVYDRNNQEKDEAWAKAEYGVVYERAGVAPGQKVYRLVEWREKSGNSSLITQVLNEDGHPIDKQDVTFYWPDAPDPPDPPTEVYPHDWHHNFIHGPTNANGDVGPGMGKGAYKGRGECGPHEVWIRDPNIPSDISKCHGMIAGTPHDHLDQKFQLMVAGEESDDPEEPNGGNGMQYVFDRVVTQHHPLGAIYILWPDDDLAYGTNARGGIVDGQELDVSDPIRKNYDGIDYARSEMSTAGTYDGVRTFWIQIHKVDSDLTPLCEDQITGFTQGEQKAVLFFMKHANGEPDPGNGDGPEEPTVPGEIKLTLEIGPVLAETIDKILSNCCCGSTVVNNMSNK